MDYYGLSKLGQFDRLDVAQAAWDTNGNLSIQTTEAAASTPSADVVQQPPHESTSTQVGQGQSRSQVPCSSLPV